MNETHDNTGYDSLGAEESGAASSILRHYAGLLDERKRNPDLPARTLDNLEWDRVLKHISDLCMSELGMTASMHLPLLVRRDAIDLRLRQVSEAQRLAAAEDRPSAGGLSDVREEVRRAERGGVLDGEQLVAVGKLAESCARLRRFFAERAEQFPALHRMATRLPGVDWLAEMLQYALDPSGMLLDTASPDLGNLRRRVISLRTKVRERAEALTKDTEYEDILQDKFFTLREGRFVLPVKVGEKGNVPGIIHGRSNSGQTAFVEPTELVELNNRLSVAELEVEREESRILTRLSGEVAGVAAELADAVAVVLFFDLTLACGRFAARIDAVVPEVGEAQVELKSAKHPLLAYREFETDGEFVCVPNDIRLGADSANEARILLISGPNTGGKTVTLKTLGLCALMVRAGLPISAADGSRIPLFERV
ncbi:MAG: hypothetical protein KC561_18260, partial [Myxococcales bacterium]|nr:hypothetical protein [Myxococcales bacterium]